MTAVSMPRKPKVAFYWCAGCGGCDEAIVDLNEDLLRVTQAVDVVLWPVALDFKRKDLEDLPDGALAAAFVNGAVRTSEQREMAHLLRAKASVLIAFGACAHMGGIPALANLFTREAILAEAYSDSISTVNPEHVRPQPSSRANGHELELPVFETVVQKLDDVVDVDYYLPGCPPTRNLILAAVEALLSGTLPAKGSVLAPDHALCEECPRRDSRPEDLAIVEFQRPQHMLADEEKCLLAQGLLCLGAATRGGCDARCIRGNMPCTGCFGPLGRVHDHGAKAIAAIASLIGSREEDEIGRIVDRIRDPVGTFYRYGLAAASVVPRPATRK